MKDKNVSIIELSQLALLSPKSTMETPNQYVKSVQS